MLPFYVGGCGGASFGAHRIAVFDIPDRISRNEPIYLDHMLLQIYIFNRSARLKCNSDRQNFQ